MQRIVSAGATHGGEVKLIYFVALQRKKSAHFIVKAPLSVQHDIRTVALHEVWLEVVSGFAASGTSQHQDVVVHSCLPTVGIGGDVFGEDDVSLIGCSVVGC